MSSKGAIWAALAAPLALTSRLGEAAGGVNVYYSLASVFGLDGRYSVVIGSLFVTVLLVLCGLYFRSKALSESALVPGARPSLAMILEEILEFVYKLAKENIGPGFAKHYPMLCAFFLVILFSNLTGLVPGFPPPTENISTNFAMGLVAFGIYNLAGIKEHGAGYLKQFLGPVAFIAPLMLLIELISHMSRPFSLAIRLAGNIFSDHLLLSVFTDVTYLVVPSALLFFGLLICFVQSFVWTLLTSIYISLAVSHDH